MSEQERLRKQRTALLDAMDCIFAIADSGFEDAGALAEAVLEVAEEASAEARADSPMKEEATIRKKREELFRRVWYTRHNRDPPSIADRAKAGAAKIREEFKDRKGRDGSPLLEHDERWAGHLEGWLAAIRWVLDETADENTDYLYDT